MGKLSIGYSDMNLEDYIRLSLDLDRAGLVWHPEIGDEVAERVTLSRIAILVDPQGLTPKELRASFLWLPSVEQLVQQLEAREAFIYHAGVTNALIYEAVVKTPGGMVETHAASLRTAFGQALREVLSSSAVETIH